MLEESFNRFSPCCPRCANSPTPDEFLELNTPWLPQLQLDTVTQNQDGEILTGTLKCLHCASVYPILDGIPILVSDPQQYIRDHWLEIHYRLDDSPQNATLLAQAAGPDHPIDALRYRLSVHLQSHFSDRYSCQDQQNHSAMEQLTREADRLYRERSDSSSNRGDPSDKNRGLFGNAERVLDVGCGLGRSLFVAAEEGATSGLGIDLDFCAIQAARKLAREGTVTLPRKQSGDCYFQERVELRESEKKSAQKIDFWVADALFPPWIPGQYRGAKDGESGPVVMAWNLLDCVQDPTALVQRISEIACGGFGALSSPYDWSAHHTDPKLWLGFSDTNPREICEDSRIDGPSPSALRDLFSSNRAGGLNPLGNIIGETERFPWVLPLHSRAAMHYQIQVLLFQR
jgi:SAM-dependent methyltransferase/uncharacterized protein YbaR (Trm112 family)